MKSHFIVGLILVLITLLLMSALASAQQVDIVPPIRTEFGMKGPTIIIEIEIDAGVTPCGIITITGPQIARDPKTHVVTVISPTVSVEWVFEGGG